MPREMVEASVERYWSVAGWAEQLVHANINAISDAYSYGVLTMHLG